MFVPVFVNSIDICIDINLSMSIGISITIDISITIGASITIGKAPAGRTDPFISSYLLTVLIPIHFGIGIAISNLS